MKKFKIITLFLLLLTLVSCSKDGLKYVNTNVIINELKEETKDVLNNEILLSYINNEYKSYLDKEYKDHKVLESDFEELLNNAKNNLLIYLKNYYISEYNLNENYFNDINDLKYIDLYYSINEKEIKTITYNYNDLILENELLIPNIDISKKYVLSKDLKIIDDVLKNNNITFNLKLVNEKEIYVVSESNVYLIKFKEVLDKPFIVNPNVYYDFKMDLNIYIYNNEGTVSLSSNEIETEDYEIIENQVIIINNLALKNLFSESRETLIFSITIKVDNTYFIEMVYLNKLK